MKTKKISILLLIIALKVSITTVFSQVVINEVMAYSAGNQGLIIFNGNSGNEYVELYNPSCSSVDVSGYFIGNRQEFSGSSGGGFRIPNVPASIIPPNGHLVLGTSTSSADPNSVDIKIPSYTYCQNSASKNFILANADGWVALYDASGTPVDAIYWSSAATNISSANDYAGIPCTPTGSPAGVVLESAQQINSGFPGVLQYVGNTTSLGKTYSRVPDGGAWVRDVTASINDLTVGNCNGGTCVTAATFSITSAVVHPTCGNPNGSITITPTSPGTYTYTWTPNVSTTSSANSLAAGSYSIQIDKNGCTKDTTIVLTNSSFPTAILSTPTNPNCGSSDGQIVLGAVTGGVAPYQYNFNGLGYSATSTYSNLAANSYSLIVKDVNGCTYTAPNIVLSSSNGPTAIISTPTNPSCGASNGQVSLGSVTGGTGPYQYNFNGLGLSSTTLYTNLSASSYTLIINDANGCSYTAPNIVLTSGNGPTGIVVTPTNTGCGAPTGQVSIGTVTGGTSPYQYNFNGLGLSTTTNYSNLAANSYTLVIQDNNGCSYTAPNVVISSANGPTAIVVTPTNTGCGAPTGQVTLGTVTGGTAPYQYNFSGLGLSSTTTYSNLVAGPYTLTVQDNNGCTFSAPIITISSATGPTAIATTKTNETCTLANGQISMSTVTGGLAPYTYNFNNLGFSSTTTYSNLAAGTYTLIVQDNNGCAYTASTISLTNTAGPTAAVVTSTDESCSLANGQVNIGAITGGIAPYQINFNNAGYVAATSYLNLSAGNYTLSVKDQNGCIYNSNTITLSNTSGPTAVVVTTTNSTCNRNDGNVLIGAVTGGLPPYQYDFNEAGYANTTSYPNLLSTTYTLSIQDGNGCVYNAPPIIVSNTAGPFDLTLTSIDASCEKNNGQIDITNTSGGTMPYTYSIDAISYSNSTNFASLNEGNYTITVKDGNGCIYSESIAIINNDSPIASFSFYPYILKNEKEDISLTDQSMGNVVIYQWLIPDGTPNTGSSANFNTKLETYEEGFYPITLIVTNEFGCVDSITKFIERRLDPIIYIPNAFTPDDDTHNNVWSYSLLGLDLNFFSMTVFNRWGEIVWKTTDQSASWDGFYKGKRVQNGTYTWVMNAKDNVEDKHLTLNGHLSIIY